MTFAGSLLTIGLVALLVLLLRSLISPTWFAQAAAGLALGTSLVALLAHEVGHG